MKISGFHFFHNITWISLASSDDGENAKLQDPLPHLALCIFNIHKLFFSGYYFGSV